MTWSLENSKNNEASKIRWELVPYMRGKVLDIGCGPYKAFPHFVGIDNGHHWGVQGADIEAEATNLEIIADSSCDAVFSSHLLEHIPYADVPNTLNEWFRVTKVGGHVILYLPDSDEYPKVGTQYANADHKFDVTYDNIVEALEKTEYSWDMTDFQKRNEDDEYSLFFVLKKL